MEISSTTHSSGGIAIVTQAKAVKAKAVKVTTLTHTPDAAKAVKGTTLIHTPDAAMDMEWAVEVTDMATLLTTVHLAMDMEAMTTQASTRATSINPMTGEQQLNTQAAPDMSLHRHMPHQADLMRRWYVLSPSWIELSAMVRAIPFVHALH